MVVIVVAVLGFRQLGWESPTLATLAAQAVAFGLAIIWRERYHRRLKRLAELHGGDLCPQCD